MKKQSSIVSLPIEAEQHIDCKLHRETSGRALSLRLAGGVLSLLLSVGLPTVPHPLDNYPCIWEWVIWRWMITGMGMGLTAAYPREPEKKTRLLGGKIGKKKKLLRRCTYYKIISSRYRVPTTGYANC